MSTKLEKISKEFILENSEIFIQQSNEFGFCWLDSSMTVSDKGKSSYLFTEPVAEIYLQNEDIIFKTIENFQIDYNHNLDIYSIVDEIVHRYDLIAVGYISYESTLKQYGIRRFKQLELPSVRFLFYKEKLEFQTKELPVFETLQNCADSSVVEIVSQSEYMQKIDTIKQHIKEGDIYQANYTTRFKINSHLSPIETYLSLRNLNPAPYASYLNFGNYQILSSSPERMFTIENNQITTCPIKGTISIGENIAEQQLNLESLLNSEKDKAELLMIVDLMRNDLGKIAKTGTVRVDSLFKPEIYSSLIHLVSEISADLNPNKTLTKIVNALLPGGSITGAPKKRAIEIIQSVEQSPRFIYTGSIGYISKEKVDFDIAIRTMYRYNNHYYIHAGGGIVADSDPKDEYNEMLLKVKNLFKAVGLQYE